MTPDSLQTPDLIYLATMSRYHSYLNTATKILQQYKGEEPFAAFLKKFFSAEKKYGSRDRKLISHLCYCYFRLGKGLIEMQVEERILTGLFICSIEPNGILEELKPEWNEKTGLSVEQKCSMFNAQLSMVNVFPWKEELSKGIDHEEFSKSFFTQPDLFLRLRPGNEESVKSKLAKAAIDFKEINPSCLSLANATKIEDVIELDNEAVIQDMNSQKTGEFMLTVRRGPSDRVWDCCSGSGGKSLLIYDINPEIELTSTDVRESIIANLKKRFANAGIKKYKSSVVDLTHSTLTTHHSPLSIPHSPFDLIIIDAPCTGSGTWSRTPEQLFFFDPVKIEQYNSIQKKIVSNVIPHLNDGGYLLYITCSVFKKENEEVVDFIKKEFQLELIQVEVLKGYDRKADTMFVAVFKREEK